MRANCVPSGRAGFIERKSFVGNNFIPGDILPDLESVEFLHHFPWILDIGGQGRAANIWKYLA